MQRWAPSGMEVVAAGDSGAMERRVAAVKGRESREKRLLKIMVGG